MQIVTSRIDSVTVFRCGAVVTRVADLVPEEGAYPQEIRLAGLPLSLEDDSLRARVVASDGGSPPVASDVRLDLRLEDEVAQPNRQGARERSEPLRRLKAHKEVLQASYQRLAALEPRPRLAEKGKAPEPAVDCRRQLVSFRQSRLAATQTRLRDLESQIEKLRGELLAPSLAAPESPLRKAVIVRLRPPADSAAAESRLYLSYRVPGARWAPAYAFRFDRDLTMAEVLMRASVYQDSGEDWSDVRLLVSTSDPTAWKELPELSSRRIGRRQSTPVKPGWRPPPAGADLLYQDYDRNRQGARSGAPPGTHPWIDLAAFPLDRDVCLLIPEHLAQRYKVLPVALSGERLKLAMADPSNAVAIDDIRLISGYDIDPLQADEDALLAAINSQFGMTSLAEAQESVKEMASQDFGMAPVMQRAPTPPMEKARRAESSYGGLIKVDLLPTERRGFSLGSALGAAVGAAAGAIGSVLGYDGDEGGGAPPPEAAMALQPGTEHLRYGALWMPGPAEAGRGRLHPLDPIRAAWHGRYLDAATERRLHKALSQAMDQASKGERASAPAGHHYPESLAGFDYLYPGDSRVHLPSDGQFHSLPLLVRSLPAQPLYVLVPRESPDVFRIAEVDSLPDLALPAGPADIYVGGDFLLATELDSVGPGATVRVGLGVEQSLKAARNTRFKETTSGLMGGTQQLRHEVELELANRLEREVRVQVWERLPEPAVEKEDVKIMVEAVEPPWERCAPPDQPELECSYRWSLTVAPKARATLKLAYVIEIPSKMEIRGGNRREPA